MAVKDVVGRFGEDLAARRLTEDGWRVLARNWRCEHGEIDIVALDGGELVIVEVKARRSEAFGGALAAVTPRKLGRLRLLAGEWLSHQDLAFASIRIDVIAVTIPHAGAPRVEHLRGVA